jgi:hypothetical protein
VKDNKNSDHFNPYNVTFPEAILRIKAKPAGEDNAIGYYLPAFVNTPLPHSQPKGTNFWRYNGESALKIIADKDFGHPYGGKSRLLVTWMISSLYRQYNIGKKSGIERNSLNDESRLIQHGHINEMLSKLGYNETTGGQNGSITYLKKHLLALVNAQYKWPRLNQGINKTGAKNRFLFAVNDEINWPDHRFDNTSESYIEVTRDLLHFIRSKTNGFVPFPIDLRAFSALRRSPMAMDLYCWLTQKMYIILNHPWRQECLTNISNRHRFVYAWSALQPQFGAQYKEQKDFTKNAKRAIKKIKLLWQHRTYTEPNGVTYQGLHIRYLRGRLELFPSPTHIPLNSPKANFYKHLSTP